MKRNTYHKASKAGISNVDLLKMKELARKEAEKMESEAIEKAFVYMLAIPLNVLANDYWEKSAKKRMPKFIDDVVSLYVSVQNGNVSNEELIDLVKEYAGLELKFEWDKRRK